MKRGFIAVADPDKRSDEADAVCKPVGITQIGTKFYENIKNQSNAVLDVTRSLGKSRREDSSLHHESPSYRRQPEQDEEHVMPRKVPGRHHRRGISLSPIPISCNETEAITELKESPRTAEA
jgi:hypothetical protein